MSNSYFTFKQFTVHQGDSAMKVGTDGVLLGAWCEVANEALIADIGCGTGLISIMLAQRSVANVVGVELDQAAASQACANAAASPWGQRITVLHEDFIQYAAYETRRFDHIVSNPPFFESSLLSPQIRRSTARHTTQLSHRALLEGVMTLLAPEGRFSLILPADTADAFEAMAVGEGLCLMRKTEVQGHSSAPVKRVLFTFSRTQQEPRLERLVIEEVRGAYTAAYKALTADFYLKF